MEDRHLCKARPIGTRKQWVTGFYAVLGEKTVIIVNEPEKFYDVDSGKNSHGNKIVEVIPNTICQCTAMPDKNRKIAYEHDIIKTPVGNAKIVWNCSPSPIDNHINVRFEVVFLDAIANDNYRHDLGYWIGKSEVIGNIFDNQKLLEV